MKINMIAIALLLTVAVVLVAGCTSSGDNNPGTASQSPAASSSGPHATPLSGMPTHVTSLTNAQKTQAANIAKADSQVQGILSKDGYSILGDADYYSSDPTLQASIVITGGNTVTTDGSVCTPDVYTVIVDLDNNKVVNMIHVEPSVLPTK